MVSNLGTLPGIVSMDARSEDNYTLIVVFNSDEVTVEQIVERIESVGDQVSDGNCNKRDLISSH